MILKGLKGDNAYLFAAITGGGTGFIPELMSKGGASGSVAGFTVPYSKQTFDRFAGEPDKYCSLQAARALSIASLREAFRDTPKGKCPIGVGVTASLTTGEGERVGREHKIFMSATSPFGTLFAHFSVAMSTREEQERQVAEMIGRFIAAALPLTKIPHKLAVFPGSFNPVHSGHKKILDEVTNGLSEEWTVSPEITFNHLFKDGVTAVDIERRVLQFNHCMLTSSTLFLDKELWLRSLNPDMEIIFVCGYDTWAKIDKEDIMAMNIHTRFIVCDRNGDRMKVRAGSTGVVHPLSASIRIEDDNSSTKVRNASRVGEWHGGKYIGNPYPRENESHS